MQGKTINGFELKRQLGVGGMAEVWYAENKIGKKAAVKLLLPKLCQDENVVSRFLTEAKVVVDLNHPNIRQVYDYGELDGRPTIIMEYLEGDDLKARMKRGQRFTDEELKKWWNQLVSALIYTHQKGIVHRDIKPGNIFVDNEGNVKLLDFGIAKVRESISSTQTGQKLGTLMYMSPEQVKDSKHVDYRTDVYSLAMTFVHLLTGKRPYDSDTSSDFEISEQIVYKPLDLSGLPMDWQNFLEPYLEKDPEKRQTLKMIGGTGKTYSFGGPNNEDDGTMVDAPSASSSSVKKEKPKAKTKATAKEKPKKKGKKALWFTLAGIAAIAAAIHVVFNMKPSDPELYPAQNGEKWGFIDKTGEFVIEPKFDLVYGFREGLAAVNVDGKWGFIDNKGNMVITPVFDYVDVGFFDGLACVSLDGQWNYIDKSGNEAFYNRFADIFSFTDGMAIISQNGLYGFIDKTGRVVIQPQYEWVGQFSEGLAAVSIDEKWGFVDKTGKMVISAKYDQVNAFSDGLALVEVDYKYGYIDKKGNYVVYPQYENADNFKEGCAPALISYQWGYINKKGEKVIGDQYDKAWPFSEGLAVIEWSNKFGFIDKKGNLVVQPIYDYAMGFENGLAYVVIDSHQGYIDKTGKVIYIDDSQPDLDEQAYQTCKTINDYRYYIANFGRNAEHYDEAANLIAQYEADSIQQVLKAQAEEEERQRIEAELKAEDAAYRKCTTIAGCNAYLKNYPEGRYVEQVMNKKKELEEAKANDEKEQETAALHTVYSGPKGDFVCTYFFESDNYNIGKRQQYNKAADQALLDKLKEGVDGFRLIAWVVPGERVELAENRANAVQKQLAKLSRNGSFNIQTVTTGIDWEMLLGLINDSWIKDKDAIIATLKNSNDKGKAFKEMCDFYPQLERDILPMLRIVEVYAY